jgi:hypothetical protein
MAHNPVGYVTLGCLVDCWGVEGEHFTSYSTQDLVVLIYGRFKLVASGGDMFKMPQA